MNLIEKLGLEKCKRIVDGAPELTTNYKDGKYYEEWFPASGLYLTASTGKIVKNQNVD